MLLVVRQDAVHQHVLGLLARLHATDVARDLRIAAERVLHVEVVGRQTPQGQALGCRQFGQGVHGWVSSRDVALMRTL